MPDALATKIEQAAQGPRSVTTEGGSATAHSLPDQIAADRYLRSRGVSRNPFAALRRRRISFSRADGVSTTSAIPPPDEVPPR